MNFVELELTVPTEDIELGQVLHGGADVRIQLSQLVPIRDAFVPYILVETDHPAAFEERVRADDRVSSLDRVEDGTGEYLYRIDWRMDATDFVDALAEHDLLVDSAVGDPVEWRFRLRGPEHENLSALHGRLQDAGIGSTVDRVRSAQRPDGGAYGLTDKQREAVTLAFTEGYFQVPREANLTELAAVVGITRQSFSRRLNRGIQRIFANTVMSEL